MGGYTIANLRDVTDQAPASGMPAELEARVARRALGGETLGPSLMRLAPGFRVPFGHRHAAQEEVYEVGDGARVKADEELVELREWDAIRFDRDTTRAVEEGTDGVELFAPSARAVMQATPSWCRAGGAISTGRPAGGADRGRTRRAA